MGRFEVSWVVGGWRWGESCRALGPNIAQHRPQQAYKVPKPMSPTNLGSFGPPSWGPRRPQHRSERGARGVDRRLDTDFTLRLLQTHVTIITFRDSYGASEVPFKARGARMQTSLLKLENRMCRRLEKEEDAPRRRTCVFREDQARVFIIICSLLFGESTFTCLNVINDIFKSPVGLIVGQVGPSWASWGRLGPCLASS